jgi:hypothetical protein
MRRSALTSAAAVSSQLDSMPRIRLIFPSLPLRRLSDKSGAGRGLEPKRQDR